MKFFKNLVLENRSYRRFQESFKIRPETLKELVDLARQTPSASNLQPLKYIISTNPEINSRIFLCLVWASKLSWKGPGEGEKPAAYIVILEDKNLSSYSAYDCGIAAQTILLGAAEKGLGGCMLGAVNREQLISDLQIPEYLKIMLVIALGKPGEKIVLEEVEPSGDTSYWRDKNDIHHTPKRKIDEIILKEYQ